ncbi:putative Holliday junction resolvase YggF [Geomicrobium sp. JCM 19037]|uniref:Holliday junction resolvase RuvX n=1 Tax=unclassified Geomicrobium TaxID=2628951 RepID=UPI00045F131F|nr:Holliday junction resolvase RuvX [Geomicrobium sp. JCM 19037]GAK05905.1 putative Holliday junction resolvase YggF [Geomicrobium sp. JCM 19037]
MRTLGLDIGDHRIGVAVSDLFGWTAQGLQTIHVKGKDDTMEELRSLIVEQEVSKVVIGLPKNMDGSIGPRAEKCQEFGRELAERVEVVVEFWDERLTTKSAERTLIEADMSRQKRKKVVDKIAAVLILQGYLDHTAQRQ